jgi:hypothetical protein
MHSNPRHHPGEAGPLTIPVLGRSILVTTAPKPVRESIQRGSGTTCGGWFPELEEARDSVALLSYKEMRALLLRDHPAVEREVW